MRTSVSVPRLAADMLLSYVEQVEQARARAAEAEAAIRGAVRLVLAALGEDPEHWTGEIETEGAALLLTLALPDEDGNDSNDG